MCLPRGVVGAGDLLPADAGAYQEIRSCAQRELTGLGEVSNTLAPCTPVELGMYCSIALFCCANTNETCVAPGVNTLRAC